MDREIKTIENLEINRDDFDWTKKPIVGMALLLHGGTVDCFKDKLDQHIFYEVGLHKVTKLAIVVPTKRNQKDEYINYLLKKQNRLN